MRVVAIPKLAKSVDDPKSYHPISLLCVSYKIIEKLIYACMEILINPLLPQEQTGFQSRKSTVHFPKKKAGAVFIHLTAANETVWHHGLTCKLLRLLPNKHMVGMIVKLIQNRNLTLNHLAGYENNAPYDELGITSGPFLFSIYIHNLPPSLPRSLSMLMTW